jgi:hypothetical protein
MSTTTIRHAATAFAATAALLLTGCQGDGGGDNAPAAAPVSAAPADNGVAALTAEQILERARTAMQGAASFRVKGEMTEDGQAVALDFKTKGKDLSGSIGMGAAKAQLLVVGGRQYMKPNEQFWAMMDDPQKAKAVTTLMADRWAKIPAGEESFSQLFNAANVNEMLKNSGKVSKGPQKDIDGVPAIGLLDEGPDGGTLYIATVGEPYPLRIEAQDAGAGQISFSEFGAAFPELKAPAEGEVVDLGELTK